MLWLRLIKQIFTAFYQFFSVERIFDSPT